MRYRGSTVVYCLAFLMLGELAVRHAGSGDDAVGLGRARPLLILGSSRSTWGLSTRVIEDELRRSGFREPQVRNVSRHASTSVGLLQHYMKEIHPQASLKSVHGVLSIEVRGSALNDSYVTPVEERLLVQMDLSPQTRDRFTGWPGADVFRSLARLDADRAAQLLLWQMHLFYLEPDWLTPVSDWLRGLRNERQRTPRTRDLDVARWRKHYTALHLRDYRLGGIQTASLERLFDQARDDGLKPVLYVLPITSAHRGFYPPGEYERLLAHVRRIGRRQRVRVLDFDTDHACELAAFHDTHHLGAGAVDEMSRRFARQVFAPLLR